MKNIFIYRLMALLISQLIFTMLFLRLGWNTRIWALINRRIKEQYNFIIWAIFICLFNITIQLLFEVIGLTYTEIINGFIMGFTFAFMPVYKK